MISFGTSAIEALSAIENIEETCKQAYPAHDFFRVFTSKMIIKKIKKEHGIQIYDLETVLARLSEEGYEEVLCQPTHMIPGSEYSKMIALVSEYKDHFEILKLGDPLLNTKEDCEEFCTVMNRVFEKMSDQYDVLVLAGHGTRHSADAIYGKIQDTFDRLGMDRAVVGTVEGKPSLEDVIDRLHEKKVKKPVVMPMLVVAGMHVREDMMGESDKSWINTLAREGWDARVIMKGLGDIPDIAHMYREHLDHAKEI